MKLAPPHAEKISRNRSLLCSDPWASPKKHKTPIMDSRNYVSFLPPQTMYTDAANLGQTIWLQQQQLYQQRQAARSTQKSPEENSGRGEKHSSSKSRSKQNKNSVEMEWKVRKLMDEEQNFVYFSKRSTS